MAASRSIVFREIYVWVGSFVGIFNCTRENRKVCEGGVRRVGPAPQNRQWGLISYQAVGNNGPEWDRRGQKLLPTSVSEYFFFFFSGASCRFVKRSTPRCVSLQIATAEGTLFACFRPFEGLQKDRKWDNSCVRWFRPISRMIGGARRPTRLITVISRFYQGVLWANQCEP